MTSRLSGCFTDGFLHRVAALLQIVVALFETVLNIINVHVLALEYVFLLRETLINQNHQQQDWQDDRCRKFIQVCVQQQRVHHQGDRNQNHVWDQWFQCFLKFWPNIALRTWHRHWLLTRDQCIESKEHGRQEEDLNTPPKQLVSSHFVIQCSNNHHQQTRTQYDTQRTGHGSGRQR